MRPAGPDLVRRWVAALLSVPAEDRDAIVRSVEDRIAELYLETGDDADEAADEADVRVVARRKTPSES